MHVFLTRHGEMETYDPERSLQSHGISPLGEVQSVLLAERLARLDDDFIILSGPSKRHVETTELVSTTLEFVRGGDVEVTVVDAFDDAQWGTEALRNAGARSLTQREWAEALAGDELLVDEPFSDVRARIVEAWRELGDGADGSVVVVTSFIVVAVILAEVLDLSLNPPQFHVNNAGLTEVLLTGDKEIILQMNSTGHLPGDLLTTSWSDY